MALGTVKEYSQVRLVSREAVSLLIRHHQFLTTAYAPARQWASTHLDQGDSRVLMLRNLGKLYSHVLHKTFDWSSCPPFSESYILTNHWVKRAHWLGSHSGRGEPFNDEDKTHLVMVLLFGQPDHGNQEYQMLNRFDMRDTEERILKAQEQLRGTGFF